MVTRLVFATVCAVLALSLAACATPTADREAAAPGSAPATATPAFPIETRAELEQYLRDHRRTVLDSLSPLARKRFLDSLDFGPKGADPYRYDRLDLTAELTADQIRQILALFGIQADDYLLSLGREKPKPAAQLAAEATPSAMAVAYDGYYEATEAAESLPDRERRTAIENAYGRYFPDGSAPRSLQAGDLELLYRATYTTAFYSGAGKYASRQAELLDELAARGLVRRKFYADTYESLIAARLFAKARSLYAEHPAGLAPLPRLIDDVPARNPVATAWKVDPTQRQLERHPVPLTQGTQVIVIAHPLCHFSQDASKDIASDPVLGPMFGRKATWLTPPLTAKDFDVVQIWNREHPGMAMLIAYDRGEWPQFGQWATPVFYFLRDRKLLAKVVGWRGAESRDEVMQASRRAGLLPGAIR